METCNPKCPVCNKKEFVHYASTQDDDYPVLDYLVCKSCGHIIDRSHPALETVVEND